MLLGVGLFKGWVLKIKGNFTWYFAYVWRSGSWFKIAPSMNLPISVQLRSDLFQRFSCQRDTQFCRVCFSFEEPIFQRFREKSLLEFSHRAIYVLFSIILLLCHPTTHDSLSSPIICARNSSIFFSLRFGSDWSAFGWCPRVSEIVLMCGAKCLSAESIWASR